jgi:hypothetical protein
MQMAGRRLREKDVMNCKHIGCRKRIYQHHITKLWYDMQLHDFTCRGQESGGLHAPKEDRRSGTRTPEGEEEGPLPAL